MKNILTQAILWMFAAVSFTACGKIASPSVTYSYGGLEQNPATVVTASTQTALKIGNWSSRGVVLSVNSDGANLQMGCASGSISSPLILDENNHFEVSGTYSVGPLLVPVSGDGNVSRNQSIEYTGDFDVSSQVLTLVMTSTTSGEVLNTFNVTYGEPNPPLLVCE